MQLNRYPETNSFYIDLLGQTSVESREISEGIERDSNLVRSNSNKIDSWSDDIGCWPAGTSGLTGMKSNLQERQQKWYRMWGLVTTLCG